MNIVILAGEKSHGPADNGVHDYPAQARLLACCLRRALGDAVETTVAYDDEWPSAAIAAADCLAVLSDGKDGDKPFATASQLATPERRAEVEALCARGGGLAIFHFSLFAPEALEGWMQEHCGGCFAWEKDGERDWHSRIGWAEGLLDRIQDHELLRGFTGAPPLREEYYHRLRFHPDAVPLVRQRALAGSGDEQHVAWCLERPDGGRGFGTSMGHSLDSFRHDGLRTLAVNAIAWCAGCEIPAGGLQVPFAERDEVAAELEGTPIDPIRVAVLAGNAAHRWHNWVESTGALLKAWGDDPRITARVHTDPADLATALEDRDVLVLNWVNWADPAGMPEAAKAGILAFLERGGGLFVHHFAGGACHPSLRDAAESDWPEYRRIVRRVWEHRDLPPGRSGHDRYRTFTCTANTQHPLTAGLGRFEVEDELYFRQHGEEPIEPLMHARSERTGADEPLLWTYDHGAARVVQCLLGHSAATYATPQARVLARRIVAWCARRALHGPPDGP